MLTANKTGINRLVRIIIEMVKNAPLTDEEKLRLKHFSAFVFLGVPIMIGFGIYNFQSEHLLPTALLLLGSAGVFIGWILLCYLPRGRIVYRINSVLFGGMLVYMMLLGGEDGSKALWMFIFPQIITLLLGRTEGLVWSAGLLASGMILFLTAPPGLAPYRFSNEFLIRFVPVYLVVTALAYWFEYFREQSRKELDAAQHRREHDFAEGAVSAGIDRTVMSDDHDKKITNHPPGKELSMPTTGC